MKWMRHKKESLHIFCRQNISFQQNSSFCLETSLHFFEHNYCSQLRPIFIHFLFIHCCCFFFLFLCIRKHHNQFESFFPRSLWLKKCFVQFSRLMELSASLECNCFEFIFLSHWRIKCQKSKNIDALKWSQWMQLWPFMRMTHSCHYNVLSSDSRLCLQFALFWFCI